MGPGADGLVVPGGHLRQAKMSSDGWFPSRSAWCRLPQAPCSPEFSQAGISLSGSSPSSHRLTYDTGK